MTKDQLTAINEITLQQDELLRFTHFSNRDALELGNFMANRMYAEKKEMSVAIRKLNGMVIFQYLTEKTGLNNQNWMDRKFRTVSAMERSSLGVWVASELNGEPPAVHGLSELEYVFAGGGFPIRLTSGELVAVLTVSNLPHIKDHDFLIRSLKEWLKMPDVPDVPDMD
ncbi:MAG: heme-binding protein [Lachnospiraceae bacterium]|nr:heme-binding protein [Lachnospiraceae bacterium]